MEIRLISNFKKGIYEAIGEDFILQEVDGDYQLSSFLGKNLYIVDIGTNTRQEILPEVKKFHLADICNLWSDRDYVYFTTAQREGEQEIRISLLRYSISQGIGKEICTFNEQLIDLEMYKKIKIWILDENYIFIQKEVRAALHNGLPQIENYLYNIEDSLTIDISDPVIKKSGIQKIALIDGNICAIKIGYSDINELEDRNRVITEIIGIINVKQFISDLVMKKEQVYIEQLDCADSNRTFPYMKFREGNIIYSRVDLDKQKEEIVMYEYATKVTKVRVNNYTGTNSESVQTYIINETPYLLVKKRDAVHLINLNTQKTEWKVGSDIQIKFITNDLIVVEKHVKRGLLKKENFYIVVYKYPDIHKAVIKQRARYTGCLITDNKKLLIFMN